MKNFHYNSLRNDIQHLALTLYPESYKVVLIRIDPTRVEAYIAHIWHTWSETVPILPFEYHVLDENFENTYRT